MLDKEIYSSKEDNVFKETKNFPPETYFKAPEARPTPPENSAKGGEIGMTGTPSKRRRKSGRSNLDNESNGSSGATESAGSSVGGTTVGAAAGGVSVAAAAVAVTVVAMSGLIAPAPDVNVQRLEAGYDYVVYELYLEDINEDMDYFVSLTHKNEEYVQELEEGFNENVIEDLLPNKAYVFSIKGEDLDGAGTITYYETTVYTANTKPEVIEDSYASSFNESFTDEVEVFWDEGDFNRIVFPVDFEKQADGECLRIVASDGNGTEYARVDCDGRTAELNVPASAVDVTIEYQKVLKLNGQEKIYETLIGGTLDFDFGVTVSDAFKIIECNYGEVLFDFSKLNGTLVSAGVVYGPEGEEIFEDITDEALSYGQSAIYTTNDGDDVFSMTAEIEVEGPYGGNPRRLVIDKEYPLETVFEVEQITYHLSEYTTEAEDLVLFDIKFWGDETLAVVKVDDGTTEIKEYSPRQTRFAYKGTTAQTYKYSLFYGDEQLTDWVEFVLDPTLKGEELAYDCPVGDPSDVLTTYNADGTVNYYVPMMFSCDDPDVLYEVILSPRMDSEIYYSGKDYFCAIENMPRRPTGFRVNVYKMISGVKHILYELYPSGGLGEERSFDVATLTNDEDGSTVTLSTYVSEAYMYDYDSFVITADGETYTVNTADFVEGIENNNKVYTLTLPQEIKNVTVKFCANQTTRYYEELAAGIEIKGEVFIEQVIELTNE